MIIEIKQILTEGHYLDDYTGKTILFETTKISTYAEKGFDKKWGLKIDNKSDIFIKNNPAVKKFFSKWKDKEIIINVYEATEDMKVSLEHFKDQSIPKTIIWFYSYGNGDFLGLDKSNNHILEYSHEDEQIIDKINNKVLFKHS